MTPTQTQVTTPRKGFKAPKWVMALAGLALGVAGTEAVNVPRITRLNQSNQTLSQSNNTLTQKNLGLEIKTELLSRQVSDLEEAAKELDVENTKINIQNELLTRANTDLTEAAKTLDTNNKKLTQENLSLSLKNEMLQRLNGVQHDAYISIIERMKHGPLVQIQAKVISELKIPGKSPLWVVTDEPTKELYALQFAKEPPMGIQQGDQYQVQGKLDLEADMHWKGDRMRLFNVETIKKQ